MTLASARAADKGADSEARMRPPDIYEHLENGAVTVDNVASTGRLTFRYGLLY